MLDSVQLRLMMGPFVSLTPPRAVMDALDTVEVTVKERGHQWFRLTFLIDKQSSLQILFLLTGGLPLLFMRVVLVATVNGVRNVLIDGVITNHSIAPGDKGSNSTLTNHGRGPDGADEPVGLERLPVSGRPCRSASSADHCEVRHVRCDSVDRPERAD